jgi:hypothetical protein
MKSLPKIPKRLRTMMVAAASSTYGKIIALNKSKKPAKAGFSYAN